MTSLSLSDLFTRRVTEHPLHISLVCESVSITYAGLEERSNQLAHYLLQSGAQRGDRIGLALNHSPHLIVSILAIIKTGALYVPIDMNYPQERIRFMIEDAQISLLLTRSDHERMFEDLAPSIIDLDDVHYSIDQQPVTKPSIAVQASDAAYMMYTSGTTGTPKGVVISHQSVAHLTYHPSFLPIHPSDTVACLSSISFDSSTLEIWSALLNGATLAIPAPEKLTPDLVVRTISTFQVSVLFLTPGLFNLMVEEHLASLRTVRYILSGGDVMSPAIAHAALQQLPNTTLINGYGPTENTIFTTTFQLPGSWDKNTPIPIGTPVDGTVIDIINEHGESVPIGQAGELIAGGDGLCLGYWQRDDLNHSRFIEKGGTRYFKTGDLVRQQQGGCIEFIGRADDQVKIRGFRIELGEIEHVLLEHPGVTACVVTATKVAPGDKRLVAYIIPAYREGWKAGEIQRYARQKLPEFMCPAHYVIKEALPLTHNGKIDRHQLRATSFERPELHTRYESPANALERALCELWSDRLRIRPIGRHDNFFDLGGNSMLAAKVLIQTEHVLQAHHPSYSHSQLPASTLYDYPTIHDLCRMLEQEPAERHSEFSSDVHLNAQIQPSHSFSPASFVQHAVLLTGATGFLGAYLIKELIALHPGIQIYCIVRARDEHHALQRIVVNMEKYHLWEERYLDHIKAIAGHLEQAQFGLPAEQYQQLTDFIDAIYHNGAMVNYVQSYTMHKNSNVRGTENILELACTGRLKPVHFLSTISVFGPAGYDRQINCIYEEARLESFHTYVQMDMGYSQSKWVAEQLVWEAERRGLPVTVFRPGFIMGDSQSGISNTEDYMGRLIKGCIQLHAFADLPNQRKEFVPVDFVSKAIAYICKEPTNFGKAYHLVPPHHRTMDLNDFFEMITTELGYDMDKQPYHVWVNALVKESQDSSNALTPFLPMLTEKIEQEKSIWELYENMPAYDSSNTRNALATTGMTCPDMDTELLRRYFSYMTRIGFLDQPENKVATT